MQKKSQLIADLTTNREGYPQGAMRQSTEIGFPGKLKNHLDITMTPFLKRKDMAGTPESPLYWVERMYQALHARQFSNPKEAYTAIMKQAEAKGITEEQRKKVLDIMSAIGLGIDEGGKLNDMQKFASIKSDDVTAAVVAATKAHYSNQQKIEAMGKLISHEKQQMRISAIKVEASEYAGTNSSIRKYSAMVTTNPLDKALLIKYITAKVVEKREVKASEFPCTVITAAEPILACLSDEGRELRKAGWSHTDIFEHFKCEAQAQPPMPTTDPGSDKKWVFDPSQKSWIATQKTPPTYGSKKVAITPPGKEEMIKELKKKDVNNPWAVAWWQYNKEQGKTPKKSNKVEALGKFNSERDAYIYNLSLDGGPDEEIGDAESTGWYGLMNGQLTREENAEDPALSKEDEGFLKGQAGAIICVDSQGFVYVDYFADETELMAKWSEIESGVSKELEGAEYRMSESKTAQRQMPKYFEEDVETDPKKQYKNDPLSRLDIPMEMAEEEESKYGTEREIENYLREHESEMGEAFEGLSSRDASSKLIKILGEEVKKAKITMGEHQILAEKIMARKARTLDEIYVELAKIRLINQG